MTIIAAPGGVRNASMFVRADVMYQGQRLHTLVKHASGGGLFRSLSTDCALLDDLSAKLAQHIATWLIKTKLPPAEASAPAPAPLEDAAAASPYNSKPPSH